MGDEHMQAAKLLFSRLHYT